MKQLLASLVALMIFATTHTAAAQDCPISTTDSQEKIVNFLQQQKANQSASAQCVTKAFVILGHSPSATEALVNLLDYRRPPTDEELLGVRKVVSISGLYPATAALAEIGPKATPLLLKAIKTSTSDLVRQNSVYTLTLIHELCNRFVSNLLEAEVANPQNTLEQRNRLKASEKFVKLRRDRAACETL